jgi:hypothetical protein
MNIKIFKHLLKTYGFAFSVSFLMVLVVHVFILAVLSFIQMESLVVSGLDVLSMTWWQRLIVVVFYLIFPMSVAGWRLLNVIHHELSNNKDVQQPPTSSED